MTKLIPDLSAYGLVTQVVKTQNKYFLRITGQNCANFVSRIAPVGLLSRTMKDGTPTLIKALAVGFDRDFILDLDQNLWSKIFPEVKMVDFVSDVHLRDSSNLVPERPTAGGQEEVKPATQSVKELWRNKNNQLVYEDADGVRFVRDERNKTFSEASAADVVSGLFLRATSQNGTNNVADCADAFVASMIAKPLSLDDLKDFITVIEPSKSGDGEYLARFVDEIELASARYVSKRGSNTIREQFISATKIFNDGQNIRVHAKNASEYVPYPVAISAIRLLGTDSVYTQKSIVVVPDRSGMSLIRLPRLARVEVYADADQDTSSAETVLYASTHAKFSVHGGGFQPQNAENALGVIYAKSHPIRGSGRVVADLTFKRYDYAEIIETLAAKSEDGVGAFVIPAPAGADDEAELNQLRDYLSIHYNFEGESLTAPALDGGRSWSVLSVGFRRPEPDREALAPLVREVDQFNEFWTWTAEVVTQRTFLDSTNEETEKVDVKLKAGTTANEINTYQVPYKSGSQIGTPTTMVPRNLEGAIQDAISEVIQTHGPIDKFVGSELHYSEAELAAYFSPEQLDAIALGIAAHERDRGMLIADQTGVGKGRALAGLMRWAILKGRNVLFLTEKFVNLSDIYRDFVHIGSTDILKPLIVNDNVSIIDERDNSVVLKSLPSEDMEGIFAQASWPQGYNFILGTYSQFRSISPKVGATDDIADVTKAEWLKRIVDENVFVFPDESHNAASMTSNTSINVQSVIKQSSNAIYSSATFAKEGENMAFYARLLPKDISDKQLSAMLAMGGETFQEVFSSMLASDGVLIRREFDLSRVTFEQQVDKSRFDRNRLMMDLVAPILGDIAKVSARADEIYRNMNRNRRDQQAAHIPVDGENKRKKFFQTRTSFGSPLYTIARLFVAALKIDIVSQDAITCLQNDQKPVILVENTIQSLFEELADSDDQIDGTVSVDLRALLKRIVKRVVTSNYRDEKDVTHKTSLLKTNYELAAQVDDIYAQIDALPIIPISAIDEVKRRIEEAGFVCDEITGRTLEVRDGRIMRRASANPTLVKNKFNSGEIDALIINSAGSTGIDLHASRRFDDQRQRVLLELQAPADILKKIQGYGRVNRYDQVSDPIIRTYLTGLPIEMRLAAMENANLRRMSANVTSNRDAAILMRGIPDLINPVGDIVCSRYAEARPELMRRLGFRVAEVQEVSNANSAVDTNAIQAFEAEVKNGTAKAVVKETKVTDGKRTANEILSRLIMLPVDLQDKVCKEMTAEFYATIEELEARGETPLRTHEMPGIVHERGRAIFDGAESEKRTSAFEAPLYLTNIVMERTVDVIKQTDVMEMVAMGDMSSGRSRACIDRLQKSADDILEAYLPPRYKTVQDALEARNADIIRRKDQIERLASCLETLQVGKELSCSLYDEVISGIITSINYPAKGMEHVASAYSVEFVVPGDIKPRYVRIQSLLNDEKFVTNEGLTGSKYEKYLEKFDNASNVRLTSGNILTGNLYKGLKLNTTHKLGRLVTYVDKEGTRRRGIMLHSRYRNLDAIPVEVPSSSAAAALISDRMSELVGGVFGDKLLTMKLKDKALVEIKLPPKTSRRLGLIYHVPKIEQLWTRTQSESDSATPTVTIPMTEFGEVYSAFLLAGVNFWSSPADREWINNWVAEANEPKKSVARLGM